MTDTLTFNSGRVVLQKDLDLGTHSLYGALYDFDGQCKKGEKYTDFHYANDSRFKVIPFKHQVESFYFEEPLDNYLPIRTYLYFFNYASELENIRRPLNSQRTRYQKIQVNPPFQNEEGVLRITLVGSKNEKCPTIKINVTV